MPLQRGSRRLGYSRSAATKDVRLFCGWDYLLDLVAQVDEIVRRLRSEEIKLPRGYRINYNNLEKCILMHKACLATFFLTGGRAREILGDRERNPPVPPLAPSNFRLDLNPRLVFVVDMPVLKSWSKVDWVVEESERPLGPPSHRKLWHYDRDRAVWVRRRFVTKIKTETRTFFFRRDEPLAPYLVEWLNVCREDGADELFDGDYYYWYAFFRLLDPMRRKYGARVTWKHIYPHWFRAQRASQLAIDYRMDLHEIADWGRWKSLDVVREYVGTAGTVLMKMLEATATWAVHSPLTAPSP